jgi:glucosamine-6-phosphate deaminase
MEVVIVDDATVGAALVAGAIALLVRERSSPVLGLATGSTPMPVYEALIAQHEAGLSFDGVTAFALDEYVGLAPSDPASYRAVLRGEFADHVGLPPEQLHTPDGLSGDLPMACSAYERTIQEAGGVDIQLLGVGTDGHIGFNEPTSSLGSLTRLKTLTTQTINDNARFFGGDPSRVPRHVITQGVATILRARHLILLAWGEGKAAAVAATVEGPVTALVPSSALQMHPHVTVVVDRGAATLLRLADYYRHVYDHKPPWQGL